MAQLFIARCLVSQGSGFELDLSLTCIMSRISDPWRMKLAVIFKQAAEKDESGQTQLEEAKIKLILRISASFDKRYPTVAVLYRS
jgi:hypothetical protein